MKKGFELLFWILALIIVAITCIIWFIISIICGKPRL
jgi:hypothetical protein